jgi:hypothetical protein
MIRMAFMSYGLHTVVAGGELCRQHPSHIAESDVSST